MKVKPGFEIGDLNSFKKLKLEAETPDDRLFIYAIHQYCEGENHLLLRYLFPTGELPIGIKLKGFIADFEKETKELPIQLESKEMGNCYYNWHSYFIRKMKGYVPQIDDKPPDSKEGKVE